MRRHADDDDSSNYTSGSNSRVKSKIEGSAIDTNNQNQNRNRKEKAARNVIENTPDSYSSIAKSRNSNQNNIFPARNAPKSIPVEEAENVPARLFFPNIETPTQRSSSNSPKKENEKKSRIAIEQNVENKKGDMSVTIFLAKNDVLALCCTIDNTVL
jgi:hypothetical protein